MLLQTLKNPNHGLVIKQQFNFHSSELSLNIIKMFRVWKFYFNRNKMLFVANEEFQLSKFSFIKREQLL